MRLRAENQAKQGLNSGLFRSKGLRVGPGFTLAELLVVIAIMALVATVSIPAFKGLLASNAMSTATRQMLDDVAFARQKAISTRSTVYMVFISPEFWNGINIASYNAQSQEQLTNLIKGQYSMYALYSEKNVGDQPGTFSPKYLTAWRSLPEGILIEPRKFEPTNAVPERVADPYDNTRYFDIRSFKRRAFQFPQTEVTNAVPKVVELPYVAFTANGGLENETEFEYLPIVRGSVFYGRQNDRPAFEEPDVHVAGYRQTERTNFTLVKIDPLTGRAKLERLEVQ